MTLEMWKNLTEIASSLGTLLAIVVGGAWTYLLFVRNRERYPQACISHEVISFKLTAAVRVVHVAITIKNTGKVLLPLQQLECRLLQVLPLAGSFAARASEPAKLIESGRQRIHWPMIDDRKWQFASGEAELEPGESETLRCDFLVQPAVTTAQVYSHIGNPSKKLIGWTCLSHIDFENLEATNAPRAGTMGRAATAD